MSSTNGLRNRAAEAGATRVTGKCEEVDDSGEIVTLSFRPDRSSEVQTVTARAVIGADGARSGVARQCLPGAERVPCVFAYHEVVEVPDEIDRRL